ncbi:CPBP family intramembrane metalloprotease [Hymenobacter sp. HMF4947]|uniref:CPBP family intramembrane metalloprotease n=1 Tax=Hymenobacter ginkgonis TaxID=2682976 RepID=A0A7K1TEK3_9BACT|nr:CPBP family intramembrane glutamic endopeptidase [Hymenobacter ginkgonis]MVN76571.1 CPBP family intramembrane metalloprotease [Hymenobacter ginkgonis]
MLFDIATLLLWGLLWGLLCLVLGAPRLVVAPRLLGLAAAACALHALVLVLPSFTYWALATGFTLPASWTNPLYHPVTWTNKVAGLLLSAGLVYGLRWVKPAEAGLKRPQALRAVAPVVVASVALVFADAYFSRHAFTHLWWNERVFFALVPGLEEELFYRGVLLGLLSRVFPRTISLPGTRTSWGGVVGILLFVLGHGLKFPGNIWLPLADGSGVQLLPYWWAGLLRFSLTDVVFQLVMGTLFLWVRERTGSVWAAAATHCLINSTLLVGHLLS